jgi:hypothetical protein
MREPSGRLEPSDRPAPRPVDHARPVDRARPIPSVRGGAPPRGTAGRHPAGIPRASAPTDLQGVPIPIPVRPRMTVAPPRATPPRSRPDPRPMRIALGLTGLAAATAMATAIMAPASTAGATGGTTAAANATTDPATSGRQAPVRHVTQYVQLQPGQTPPPQAAVKVVPTPKPQVVIVTTRQSGVP